MNVSGSLLTQPYAMCEELMYRDATSSNHANTIKPQIDMGRNGLRMSKRYIRSWLTNNKKPRQGIQYRRT